MAEGFDSKQSDILRWIQSVREASPDPPQEEHDRGLTSDPNFQMVFGALPAVPREHKALGKQLSAPSSDGVSTRPRYASLGDVLPDKQKMKQPPHRSTTPVQEKSRGQGNARSSRIEIKHARQKSLSPLPDPTQKLDLPAFNPRSCSDKKLFEAKQPLVTHCLLPLPGSSTPKSRLLRVSSLQPKSAPASPNFGFRRKQITVDVDITAPLRSGRLVREKSFSHDNLTKSDMFSDSDVSSHGGNDAADFSDYNVSTVHSGDESTGRETSVRVTGEPSPSLTVTESTHTCQASLTGKSSNARSEAGSSESQPTSEGRQLLQGEGHQPKDHDWSPVATSHSPLPRPPVATSHSPLPRPPVATSPSPLPQYPSTITTTGTPTPPAEKATLLPSSTENRTHVSAKIPSPIGWKQPPQLPLFSSPSPVGWRRQQALSSSSSPSPVGWQHQRPVSSSSSPSPTERPHLLSPTQNPTHKATPLSHQKLQQLQLLEKMQSFQFQEEEREKLTAPPPTVKFLSRRSPTFPPSRLRPTTRRPSDYSSLSSTSSSSGLEGSVPRRSSTLSEDLITRGIDRRLHLEKDPQMVKSGLHVKLERSTSPLAGQRTLSHHRTVSPKLAPPVRHTNTETELFVRHPDHQEPQKEHVGRQDSGIGTQASSTTSGRYDFR